MHDREQIMWRDFEGKEYSSRGASASWIAQWFRGMAGLRVRGSRYRLL
jgi:hypothetical protein